MAYRIKARPPLEQEMQRILLERIGDSLDQLRNPDDVLDTSIHQVRKNMKKIRAVLRLYRFALPGNEYGFMNEFCRDFAGQFAQLRDAKVFPETLELVNIDGKGSFKDDLPGIMSRLEEHYRRTRQDLLDQSNWRTKSSLQLETVRKNLDEWDLKDLKPGQLGKGLKQVYRRGRKAMKAAGENPSGEQYHEWRKRVKYLWYQVRLLQDAWPAVMKGYRRSLHQLSGLLGDEHDLYVLQKATSGSGPLSPLPAEVKDKLNTALQNKREEIQSGLWPLARKIYQEKPGAFSSRILGYWEVIASSGK